MLTIKNLVKRFGSLRALDGVSLEAEGDSIVGLIGPNGSGKTTLFNVVSGFYEKDGGEIFFKGERIDGLPPNNIAKKGLCRTFQVSKAPEKMTVLENMLLAAEQQIGEDPFSALFMRSRVKKSENENLARAMELLGMLQLSELKNDYAGDLSGGQKKLLSLGRVFMLKPDMILLDEPTAGMSIDETRQMIKLIDAVTAGKTLVIIEHDMEVVFTLADIVTVMNYGTVVTSGKPEEIRGDRRIKEIYLGEK